MARTVLIQEDLEAMKCPCGVEDCEHQGILIHSRCHPETPTWARYRNGVLTILCSECAKEVVPIKVAEHG